MKSTRTRKKRTLAGTKRLPEAWRRGPGGIHRDPKRGPSGLPMTPSTRKPHKAKIPAISATPPKWTACDNYHIQTSADGSSRSRRQFYETEVGWVHPAIGGGPPREASDHLLQGARGSWKPTQNQLPQLKQKHRQNTEKGQCKA